MNRNILATAIFAAAALTASAQQLSQEIDVTHDIVPPPPGQPSAADARDRPQSRVAVAHRVQPAHDECPCGAYCLVLPAGGVERHAAHIALSRLPHGGILACISCGGFGRLPLRRQRPHSPVGMGQFNGANYKSGGIEHRHSTTALGMDLHQPLASGHISMPASTTASHRSTPITKFLPTCTVSTAHGISMSMPST